MKTLGTILLVIGTVVASLGGAKLPSASVPISAAGFAILIAALVCLRVRRPSRKTGDERAGSSFRSLLASLPERIEQLVRDAPTLELPALVRELDRLDGEILAPIAEASAKLLPELGAARFAELFAAFAAAERSLARAWSAAADGQRAEAERSLARALERSRASLASLR